MQRRKNFAVSRSVESQMSYARFQTWACEPCSIPRCFAMLWGTLLGMQNLPKAKGSQELKVVEELKISKQIQANLSKFNPERSEIIETIQETHAPNLATCGRRRGVRSRYQQDRQAVQNVKHSVGSNDRSKMIQDDPRRVDKIWLQQLLKEFNGFVEIQSTSRI